MGRTNQISILIPFSFPSTSAAVFSADFHLKLHWQSEGAFHGGQGPIVYIILFKDVADSKEVYWIKVIFFLPWNDKKFKF